MSDRGPFAAGGGDDIINAILYVLHSGCSWRMIPGSSAARSMVYLWFVQLRDEGVFETINDHLLIRDRERVGREASRRRRCSTARVPRPPSHRL